MYKLITFDATGTLLKLKHPVGQIYSTTASNFGIISDPTKIGDGFKQSWIDMNKRYPNFGYSSVGWKNWWKNIVIESFMKSHEHSFTEKQLQPVAEKLIDIFSTNEGWDISEGCLVTLKYLKSKQIKLGVLSNFDSRLPGILKSFGIYDSFDFIIYSYEVGFMKPQLNMFRLAEIKSGFEVNREERTGFLHVGDNIELDYLAALNAGWDAALITKKKEQIFTSYPTLDSKQIFNSLSDLYEYIK